MNVEARDLLSDERVVLSKRANSVVRYTEQGLQRVAALHTVLQAFGWGGKEAIGGKLHLTSYRLLFKSHKINRLTGSFSIFLPTIRGVRNSSRGLVRRVTVTVAGQEHEFVVWGVPRLVAALDEQRRALDRGRLDHAIRAAAGTPAALGLGLASPDLIDKLLRGGSPSQIESSLGDVATDPFALSTVVNVIDLAQLLHEK